MNEESRVRRVAALEVGETHSESIRLSGADLENGIVGMTSEKIRNRMAPGVRRATAETGNQYTLEACHAVVGGVAVLVTLAATRWA